MIRPAVESDLPGLYEVINRAAERYRGRVPKECLSEPYMPMSELEAEFGRMQFFVETPSPGGSLHGAMAVQRVEDVDLIRHAYVLPELQGQGIGSRLLRHIIGGSDAGRILVGTWAAAEWAVRFYEGHGFRLCPADMTEPLLLRYWNVPALQRRHSVVLERERNRKQTC